MHVCVYIQKILLRLNNLSNGSPTLLFVNVHTHTHTHIYLSNTEPAT